MTIHFGTFGNRPQVWAVGGGKGGTGKSLVAANLGLHLAEMGRRVVLVDGDLGAPNLHTFLGLDPPPLALSDFIKRRVASLEEVMVGTGVPRLRLISGALNSLDAESLKHFQKRRLLRVLLDLPADIVLVDLGAGTSLNVLDFFCVADRGLMVILPEATSIENCYRFLQAVFLRRLQHVGRSLGYQSIVDLVMEHRQRAFLGRPGEILDEIARIDISAAETLASHLEAFLPNLVINQARDHEDATLGESMQAVAERILRIPLRFTDPISYDPVLVRSVKTRRPFLLEYPRSRTAEAFRGVAEMVAWPADPRGERPPRLAGTLHRGAPGLDPYAALDLRPGATQEEILTGYLRLRRAFRRDSPAIIPLDCETERRAVMIEIEEAFRTLSRNISATPIGSFARRPVAQL
jgi:flagellar biosynthesis protein FlhG